MLPIRKNGRFSTIGRIARTTGAALFLVSCHSAPFGIAPALREPEVLPITVFHNRVYLNARVGDSEPMTLVLDNGASVSGLSTTAAARLGIRSAGTASLLGNGERPLSVGLARDVPFTIGDLRLREPVVALLPLDEFVSLEGKESDGVLGKDVFAHYVVDIDYSRGTVTLRPPETYTYRGDGTIVPLRVAKDFTTATMDGRLTLADRRPVPVRLALDVGTYSGLRLYSSFTLAHWLALRPPVNVQSFGFGLGGDFPTIVARAASLGIGTRELQSPMVEASRATAGATARTDVDGTIGGGILRHFHVIVDYRHSQMILEPSAATAEPFEADLSGLLIEAHGPAFVVRRAAVNAGIYEGDTLLQVDSRPAAMLGLRGMRELFSRPGRFPIVLRRAGVRHVQLFEIRGLP